MGCEAGDSFNGAATDSSRRRTGQTWAWAPRRCFNGAPRLIRRGDGQGLNALVEAVNYHLITAAGHPPPSDYHASFLQLAELRVVDSEFARSIARCAGLRNRLVHEYEEIDPRKLFESLQAAKNDIVAYVRGVETYLDRTLEQ